MNFKCMYIRAGSDSDDYIAKIVSVFLIGHVREYVRAQCDDCLLVKLSL